MEENGGLVNGSRMVGMLKFTQSGWEVGLLARSQCLKGSWGYKSGLAFFSYPAVNDPRETSLVGLADTSQGTMGTRRSWLMWDSSMQVSFTPLCLTEVESG